MIVKEHMNKAFNCIRDLYENHFNKSSLEHLQTFVPKLHICKNTNQKHKSSEPNEDELFQHQPAAKTTVENHCCSTHKSYFVNEVQLS